MSKVVECPGCYYEFALDEDVIEDEVIPYPDCGADLEIINLTNKGATVEIAEKSEEDWGE